MSKIIIRIRMFFDFMLTLLWFFPDVRFILAIRKIPGLISYVEVLFLYKLAMRGWGVGAIVEIGSYLGRSTCALAEGLKKRGGGEIYAVDPMLDKKIQELFLLNLKKMKVEDRVVLMQKKSEEAAAQFLGHIRFLFIDGSHEYEDVANDIRLWGKYLIDGGIIGLHDFLPDHHPYIRPGVNRAAYEFLKESADFVELGIIDSILVISKKPSQNKNLMQRFERFTKLRRKIKRLAGIKNDIL